MGNTSSRHGGSDSPSSRGLGERGGTPSPHRTGQSGSSGAVLVSSGGVGTSSSLAAGATAGATGTSGGANSKQSSSTSAYAATPLFPQDAKVDNGHLLPLSNIYPNSAQDWVHDKVQTLIVERKLAPFYRGLEDFDESAEFDKDEIDGLLDTIGDEQSKKWRKDKRLYSKEDRLAEAAMYKRAQECPICFLYYPPLINTSRCCDQPICTECFVQIKRADPTTTNLISEPAACPYCVEPNFGVTYIPPPVSRRTGLGAPKSARPSDRLTRSGSSNSAVATEDAEEEHDMGPAAAAHARRKSLSHTAAEVVTVDAIQQDWEAKLASIRATAARRAARRIIFRQIGDRLVPVGVSSGQRELNPNNHIIDEQGRIILTGPVPIVGQSSGLTTSNVDAGGLGAFSSSPGRLLGRGVRRHRNSQGAGGSDGDHRMMHMGPDLEELMVMEAMRLSMLDEEERRKKAEKEAKKAAKNKRKSSTPDPAAAPSTSTAAPSTSRLSLEAIRNSLDNVRHREGSTSHHNNIGTATSSGSGLNVPSSNGTANPTSSVGPSTNTASAVPGAAASSQYLGMPPIQRNDSEASMITHNLPPPLVPTKAAPTSAQSHSNGTATRTLRPLSRQEEEDLL